MHTSHVPLRGHPVGLYGQQCRSCDCRSSPRRRQNSNRSLGMPVPVLESREPDFLLLLEYLQSVSLFVHFLLSTFELGNAGGKTGRLPGVHDDACWQSGDKCSMPGSASYLLGHREGLVPFSSVASVSGSITELTELSGHCCLCPFTKKNHDVVERK